jgi:3-phosphoshikimate 1-carboxyvinyltransferase
VAVTLPGDKSIAQRALLIASIARTTSTITNLPSSDDVIATQSALARVFTSPEEIHVGNSATLARALMGLLVGQGITATIVGYEQLSRRPMDRVAEPLAQLFGGKVMALSPTGTLPARLFAREPRAANVFVDTRVPSAQVKTAVLLAAVRFAGEVHVREPAATRDHTERMLASLGVEIAARTPRDVVMRAPARFDGFTLNVPADPSSAALLCIPVLNRPGKSLAFHDVLLNPHRLGFARALERMGATITITEREQRLGEPVGTLEVSGASLRGIDVVPHDIPDLIDEVPVLVAAAILAQGESRIRGLKELRIKESDRLARLVDLARAFGAAAEVVDDDLLIRPRSAGAASPAIRTDGDHRIAMAARSLGLALGIDVVLDAPGCESKSFPGFDMALDDVARSI